MSGIFFYLVPVFFGGLVGYIIEYAENYRRGHPITVGDIVFSIVTAPLGYFILLDLITRIPLHKIFDIVLFQKKKKDS